MNNAKPPAAQKADKAAKISIYDLDRTLLSKPTFTAFLIFAARYLGKMLWWRAAIWICALIGYKLRLYSRKPLKQFGLRLFVDRVIDAPLREALATDFAASVVPDDLQPGAVQAIQRDRDDGYRLVMATAAPDIYAAEIARLLDFDDVVATRHERLPDGAISHRLDGENCYGDEKLRRVFEWMQSKKLDRGQCHIRFYSDHHSDAPLLDHADEGYLIGFGRKIILTAAQRGWLAQDWSA